jgi:putative component of membrane protein insertase Oxa1/YidC/SpoIIIJ protein YidD
MTFGLFRGFLKGAKRILSCHPLGGEGFEPVKKLKIKK